MEHLKSIENTLIAEIQKQMDCLECVNAKELGEVVDMVKDIEEAIYYYTITEAMKHNDVCEYCNEDINTKKVSHKSKSIDSYMHELTDEVLDMTKDATTEEKQILKNKMNLLVQKI